MLTAQELVGYRIERLSGERYSLQLFQNGLLIYKSYDEGVRDGVYKSVECFNVKKTPFFRKWKSVAHDRWLFLDDCAHTAPGLGVREVLIFRNHFAGSLFVHHSNITHSDLPVSDIKEKDYPSLMGDWADDFTSSFFEMRPTLSCLEQSEYSDYLDPFLEEDIHEVYRHADKERTGGCESFARPCLNSYHGNPNLERSKRCLIGQAKMEDYLNKTLLRNLSQAKSQEDFDARFLKVIAKCQKIYPYHYLFETDLERYLSQILLAYTLKGEIKSLTLLRYLHPDQKDVMAWRNENFIVLDDVMLGLKYYRWKAEKEKHMPILFYQFLQQIKTSTGA
jgi:hypothetical protein